MYRFSLKHFATVGVEWNDCDVMIITVDKRYYARDSIVSGSRRQPGRQQYCCITTLHPLSSQWTTGRTYSLLLEHVIAHRGRGAWARPVIDWVNIAVGSRWMYNLRSRALWHRASWWWETGEWMFGPDAAGAIPYWRHATRCCCCCCNDDARIFVWCTMCGYYERLGKWRCRRCIPLPDSAACVLILTLVGHQRGDCGRRPVWRLRHPMMWWSAAAAAAANIHPTQQTVAQTKIDEENRFARCR